MVVGVDIMAPISSFGAPICRCWWSRLSSCTGQRCTIPPQTRIACPICIIRRPSTRLMQPRFAFMVVGDDIMAPISSFGAPICRCWSPRCFFYCKLFSFTFPVIFLALSSAFGGQWYSVYLLFGWCYFFFQLTLYDFLGFYHTWVFATSCSTFLFFSVIN